MHAGRTARERARAELTREIKEEARRQLGTVGADGLSLRAVARELGMVSSALYRYFPSRDDLLTALIVDAYDAVGAAAEEAAARQPPADFRGRWRAACRAVRQWATGTHNEYALIYGSPVPGYRAPQATVGPAARVPLVLTGIVRDAWHAGAISGDGSLSPALTEQMTALAAVAAPGLPPGILARTAVAWTQLFGIISFELFGQFANAIEPADELFDYATDQMMEFIGMPHHPARLPPDMTAVGLIGSGHIGSTVARLAVDAGHQVILSNSRGPETLAELVAELGTSARAATPDEAAQAGDLVVVTIPLKAYGQVPAASLAGKVVIDTGNYYPERDGQIPELDSLTSSEYLQRLIPGAQVVKVFNNIFFKHLLNLARPAGASDRTYLPIAGDDPSAKSSVTEFLDSIGYGAVDAGSLADSWRQEPGTPIYGGPYGQFSDEKGTPASEDTIRTALAAATRLRAPAISLLMPTGISGRPLAHGERRMP